MNDILSKIQKTSKVASIVLKILYISCIAGFFISFVTLIWLFASPSVTSVDILRLGGTAVKVGIPVAGFGDYTPPELIVLLIAGIVSLAFDFFILRYAYMIFKDISKGGIPFEPVHAKRLKKIAVLMLVGTLVTRIATDSSASVFAPAFNMESSSFIIMIVAAVVFYCMGLIFQYGAQLQQQSDEML